MEPDNGNSVDSVNSIDPIDLTNPTNLKITNLKITNPNITISNNQNANQEASNLVDKNISIVGDSIQQIKEVDTSEEFINKIDGLKQLLKDIRLFLVILKENLVKNKCAPNFLVKINKIINYLDIDADKNELNIFLTNIKISFTNLIAKNLSVSYIINEINEKHELITVNNILDMITDTLLTLIETDNMYLDCIENAFANSFITHTKIKVNLSAKEIIEEHHNNICSHDEVIYNKIQGQDIKNKLNMFYYNILNSLLILIKEKFNLENNSDINFLNLLGNVGMKILKLIKRVIIVLIKYLFYVEQKCPKTDFKLTKLAISTYKLYIQTINSMCKEIEILNNLRLKIIKERVNENDVYNKLIKKIAKIPESVELNAVSLIAAENFNSSTLIYNYKYLLLLLLVILITYYVYNKYIKK